jgi:hypothetical protein
MLHHPSPFADSEYLRHVLMRLHAKGDDAWRTDPEANELMIFAIERFGRLAEKHGLEADDGGSAAFEAMRNPSVIFGDDPWGIIVHAVNTTLAAWEFANDALCSLETARRGGLSGCCAERFSDRENELWEYHPAFAVTDNDDEDEPAEEDGPSITEQTETIVLLLNEYGWPLETAAIATEIILFGLADTGSRPAAYERLRREKRWCVMTNLAPATWTALLRLLLGDPSDWAGISNKGKGILLRLALEEDVDDLARDPELVGRIRLAAPPLRRRVA